MTQIFKQYRLEIILGVAVLMAGGIVLLTGFRNDWYTNIGFLILGVLLSWFIMQMTDTRRRENALKDVAAAVHAELTDRVARCCFDLEAPWKKFLAKEASVSMRHDSLWLRKFEPYKPVVYLANTGRLPILGSRAALALIRFHYRLASYRREILGVEAILRATPLAAMSPQSAYRIGWRLRQALREGERALIELGSLVTDCDIVEASAIAAYDQTRDTAAPDGTLRERIKKLIAD